MNSVDRHTHSALLREIRSSTVPEEVKKCMYYRLKELETGKHDSPNFPKYTNGEYKNGKD